MPSRDLLLVPYTTSREYQHIRVQHRNAQLSFVSVPKSKYEDTIDNRHVIVFCCVCVIIAMESTDSISIIVYIRVDHRLQLWIIIANCTCSGFVGMWVWSISQQYLHTSEVGQFKVLWELHTLVSNFTLGLRRVAYISSCISWFRIVLLDQDFHCLQMITHNSAVQGCNTILRVNGQRQPCLYQLYVHTILLHQYLKYFIHVTWT